jgi:signal transduction histidine kinase
MDIAPDGHIWVGAFNDGISRLNPSTGIVKRFGGENSGLPADNIRSIIINDDASAMAVTVRGIAMYDPETDQWSSVRMIDAPGGASPDDFFLMDALEDNVGRLWLATEDGGLFRYNENRSRVDYFRHDGVAESGLRTNILLALHEDVNDNLWVGTDDRGLHRWLPEFGMDTLATKMYAQADGLPAADAGALFSDASGRLWVASDTELAVLEPATDRFRSFGVDDGLDTGRFTDNGQWQDPESGELWMGHGRGVVVFDPDKVVQKSPAPKVHLSALRLFNSVDAAGAPVSVPGIRSLSQIELRHTDNIIELDLATSSYRNTDQQQFEYRLEGLSEAWISLGNRSTITLTNLDAGKYTLWLRASNDDDVWSEDTRALTIRQLPPWWASTVAYIIYSLLLVGAVSGTWVGQRRKLVATERRRAEDERKELELQKARELEVAFKKLDAAHSQLKETQDQLVHSEKMASLGQLTAGIAHEIKNPLNFVKNFAELNTELLEELIEEIEGLDVPEDVQDLVEDILSNARHIVKHGSRADTIVASMMDHAVAGSGEKEPTDINAHVQEFANLSYHAWQAQNDETVIKIGFDLADDIPSVPIVAQEMGRVWLNIFNNAYYAVNEKADSTAESYTPTITVGSRSVENGIEVTITDNGPGIPPDERGNIFDPFYTTKPTGFGNTGLGLSMTHDIVSKGHSGTLIVGESDSGGAVFTIILPS